MKYYYLKVGDVICSGDEYMFFGGTWKNINLYLPQRIGTMMKREMSPYRRQIKRKKKIG